MTAFPMHETIEASTADAKAAHDVQVALSAAAVRPAGRAFLIGPDDVKVELPGPLFRILRQAAAMLAQGHKVTLAPVHKQLSTQEAADLLNVSRPHFIKLLDRGEIPYDKTGRHRRVKFGDVVDFMHRRDDMRRQRLREMIRRSEEMGLYDAEEFAIEPTR